MKTRIWLALHNLGRYLVTHSERQMGADRKGKMFCADCGRFIHRGHHFTVLSAKHKNCGDVKLNGQDLLPQPLGRMVAGE